MSLLGKGALLGWSLETVVPHLVLHSRGFPRAVPGLARGQEHVDGLSMSRWFCGNPGMGGTVDSSPASGLKGVPSFHQLSVPDSPRAMGSPCGSQTSQHALYTHGVRGQGGTVTIQGRHVGLGGLQ